MDFIRDLIIPCSNDNWNKYRATVNCIISPLFLLYFNPIIGDDIFNPFDYDFIPLIITPVGLVIAFIVYYTSHIKNPPSYSWIFCVLAFLNSISLIGLIADQLVDFMVFTQLLTNISKVLLGMTVLSYGNSAGDYFTNSSLSKLGYGIMAMTACFAGQLFNLLAGFGATITI